MRRQRKSQSKDFDDSMIHIGFTREQLEQHLKETAERAKRNAESEPILEDEETP